MPKLMEKQNSRKLELLRETLIGFLDNATHIENYNIFAVRSFGHNIHSERRLGGNCQAGKSRRERKS